MRALSNNNYRKSLPYTGIKVHSNKFSEDDTGYDSQTNRLNKKKSINNVPVFSSSSSSSSSSNQINRIMKLVENIPSPTDLSTTNVTSDVVLHSTVTRYIAQYSRKSQASPSVRKIQRRHIKPLPDSTSDSADSFALSNHIELGSSSNEKQVQTQTISSINIPSFGGNLEYIHDNRFNSMTAVDQIHNDIVDIQFNEKRSSWITSLGETLRSLPANIIAVVFIGLIGGLIVSAILVITII